MKPYKLKKFIRLRQAEKDLCQAINEYQEICAAISAAKKEIQKRLAWLGIDMADSIHDKSLDDLLDWFFRKKYYCNMQQSKAYMFYMLAVRKVRP